MPWQDIKLGKRTLAFTHNCPIYLGQIVYTNTYAHRLLLPLQPIPK
jgi:hypothetical protein